MSAEAERCNHAMRIDWRTVIFRCQFPALGHRRSRRQQLYLRIFMLMRINAGNKSLQKEKASCYHFGPAALKYFNNPNDGPARALS